MQKNSNTFKLLSISSDLRNAGMAILSENHEQVKAFLEHARNLNKELNKPFSYLETTSNDVPSNQIDRIKKADKLTTWANILQR